MSDNESGVPIYDEVDLDDAGVNEIVTSAMEAFWGAVRKQLPEARSGDLPPDAAVRFAVECERAVRLWLDLNVPGVRGR